jgi:hypothetical protein
MSLTKGSSSLSSTTVSIVRLSILFNIVTTLLWYVLPPICILWKRCV